MPHPISTIELFFIAKAIMKNTVKYIKIIASENHIVDIGSYSLLIEFNNYFVIRPSIAKKDDTYDLQSDYMKYGKPIEGHFADAEYSSDLNIISNEVLAKYLRELGIPQSFKH